MNITITDKNGNERRTYRNARFDFDERGAIITGTHVSVPGEGWRPDPKGTALKNVHSLREAETYALVTIRVPINNIRTVQRGGGLEYAGTRYAGWPVECIEVVE
jgi:hypothetical protein